MKPSTNNEQADLAIQQKADFKWAAFDYVIAVYVAIALISLAAIIVYLMWNTAAGLANQIHRLENVEFATKSLKSDFDALAEREIGDNSHLPEDAAILKRISAIENTLAASSSEVLNVAVMGQRLVAIDDRLKTMESRFSAEIDRLYGFFMGTIVAAIVAISITLLLARKREI